MLRRITSLLFALLLTLYATGCTQEETYSHAELSIVLDSSFSRFESTEYDLALEGEDMTVGIKRISLYAAAHSGIPDSLSPHRFAEFFMAQRDINGQVYNYGDIPYFSLYEQVSGTEFYTLYTFYRSRHAYFIVTMATKSTKESELRETMLGFCDSVYFTE